MVFGSLGLASCSRGLLLVRVPQCLAADLRLHCKTLQAQRRLLDHPALLPVAHRLFQHLHFTVQVYLLLLFLNDEGGLRNSLAVLVLATWLQHLLVLLSKLVLLPFLLVGSLRVRLAVEHLLVPGFVAFEYTEDFSVLGRVRARRVDESTEPQAVLFEALLVSFSYSKCLDTSFIFQFEGRFGGTVLDDAEHLDVELGVLDEAAVPADILILNISLADVALVLNLYELCLDDEAEDLEHVADN